MGIRGRKLLGVPVLALAIIGVLVGSVGAAWYWASGPITSRMISVSGNVQAKVVDPLSSWDTGVQVAYEELTEVTVMYQGGGLGLDPNLDYTFIKVDFTNAVDLYMSIDITGTNGMAVTANVRYLALQEDYTWTSADMSLATDVALDGSESINLELLGDPLYALYENGDCVLFLVVEFDIGPGTLGIGDHTFNAVFSIGDSL